MRPNPYNAEKRRKELEKKKKKEEKKVRKAMMKDENNVIPDVSDAEFSQETDREDEIE